MVQEHSAGAIIFHRRGQEPAYLLLHYRAGHWDHVKGHLEQGETIEQTLHREAEEETGLIELQLIDGFQELVQYSFQRGSTTVDKRVDMLLAETSTTDVAVTAPDEHQGIGWFTYDQAMDQLTFPEARRVLTAAHRHIQDLLDS